jgi:hypothetical protein
MKNKKIIKLENYIFTIQWFFDTELAKDRYSYSVSYPGGSNVSVGYGKHNEIIYPTFDSALDSAIKSVSVKDDIRYKRIRREVYLDILLKK